MTEEANEEAIDKIVRRVRSEVRDDLLFNVIAPLQDKIEWLSRTVVQLYALATHRKQLTSIQLTRAAQPEDEALMKRLASAEKEMERRISRFLGAMEKTTDPAETHAAWLSGLQKEFERMKLDILIREHDLLPPLPNADQP